MRPDEMISDQQILERAVTGRTESLFAEDMAVAADKIRAGFEGASVLIVGAAGSIGRQIISQDLNQRPAKTVLLDINENGMAEVMRSVRNVFRADELNQVTSAVFDFGAPCLGDFIVEHGPFDLVLDLAAVKHVRAERDRHSMLHMLQTNVSKQMHLFSTLRDVGFTGRLFAVSTDKAADPVSAMGASKRLMEAALFVVADGHFTGTSTRFANVAFSDGSLLQSFVNRLSARHPIAVPADTTRFFYSHKEAAEVCLLATIMADPGHVLVPKAELAFTETVLADAAVAFLDLHGYQPEYTDNEVSARELARSAAKGGRYPVLLTQRNTAGEKECEIFVGHSEHEKPVGLPHFDQIRQTRIPEVELKAFVNRIAEYGAGKAGDMAEILSTVKELVPNFQHVESQHNLDGRL